MVLESLDALFGFGIPLPAEAVAMHLEALEGVFAGWAGRRARAQRPAWFKITWFWRWHAVGQ